MSLRHGVTAKEEANLKKAIKEGKPWSEARKLLSDVDESIVKTNIWDPMVEAVGAEKKSSKKEPEKKSGGKKGDDKNVDDLLGT